MTTPSAPSPGLASVLEWTRRGGKFPTVASPDPARVLRDCAESTSQMNLPDALPVNENAERAILGAVLLDNPAHAEAVKAGLSANDFSLDSHQKIWLAMGALMKAQRAVDIVTLSEELTRSKQIRTVGGVAYLAALTEGLPRLPRVDEYTSIVRAKACERRMLNLAECLKGRIVNGVESGAAICAWAAEEFGALAEAQGPDGARSDNLRPDLIRLADVEARPVDWLWKLYLAFGMLAMLSGDPGAGKTYIALAIAAGFTRARTPDDEKCSPINVLYMSVENAAAEVIRPRFDSLGGDASRFHLLRGTICTEGGESIQGAISLSDISVLDAALEKTRAKLVIVDPIQSYLGATVDLHRSNETRPVLDGLAKLAEKHRCAVLLLRHLSKQNGGKAIHRGLGSIDLTGAVRSEMLAGSLPDDPEARALVHIKSNLGAYGPTLGYSIDSEGRFTWTGRSEITAGQMLEAPSNAEERSAIDDALEWLSDFLSDGSKEQQECRKRAEAAGISFATLRRAKNALRVHSFKAGVRAAWLWELPENGPKEGKVEI